MIRVLIAEDQSLVRGALRALLELEGDLQVVAEVGRGDGERVIDRDLAAAALALGATPLSPREAEVLRAGRDGATVAGIASRLFLSEGTVRNYLSGAISKTGTRTRVEAARVAEEKGWL